MLLVITLLGQYLGEGECGVDENTAEGDERLATDIITRLPPSVEKGIETTVPGSNFISSWGNSSTGDEDSCSEVRTHLSFPLEYFSPERPIRTVAYHEDIYSLLLRYPPRKAVPIGSNHQADIPEWGTQSRNAIKISDTSEAILDANCIAEDKNEKRLMGTCVIPMPDLELADEIGNIRTDCSCLDEGSVGCVRQHVMESREKLKKVLGQKRFAELGFCDMGEQVARKWSEEEEQLFHEIVFSNAASLGKNYWNHLFAVFPFRTKKDIVCYYFNVFMLRRRAEQNRCDRMNIDSDSDEWQGSDGYDDNELETTEEDEDSVVESPVHHNDCAHNLIDKDDLHVYDEGAADDVSDNENFDFACGRNLTSFSETCPGKSLDNCNFSSRSHLLDKIPWDERVDQETQDDSCTSTDTGVSSEGTHVRATNDDHWPSCNGLSGGSGVDVLEPCDAKVWDIDYTMCPKSKVDFLPTCSMIEEVFGDELRNYEVSDGKRLR